MKQKEFLIISITIFLTLIAWITADLYHIATSEKLKVKDTASAKPINVKIDVAVFDLLEQKR